MTPGGYGSPPALFNTVSPYMPDYYPGSMQVHQPGVTAGVGDPYAGSLFATAQPGPGGAGYLYQSPSSQGGLGPADDIRTVFISGLPHDVKERELHNLLRFMLGYEASQMNWKTGGPQGFALFVTGAHARAMVDILSGLQFDDGVLLRAEMAHKNMFIKVGNAQQQVALLAGLDSTYLLSFRASHGSQQSHWGHAAMQAFAGLGVAMSAAAAALLSR